MKRLIIALLGLAMFALGACSGVAADTPKAPAQTSKPQTSVKPPPLEDRSIPEDEYTPSDPPAAVEPTAPDSELDVPDPVSYSGSGDDVVQIDWPAMDIGFLTFTCDGCTGNVIVRTDAPSLLVNTVGAYEGTHWINVQGASASTVTIRANSAWDMTITGMDEIPAALAGDTVSGSGDAVYLVTTDTGAATFTNNGQGNFIVQTYDPGSFTAPMGLAVNTIGSYEGTVPVPPMGFVQIESDGDWTMTTE